jgi:hypothetical protein
MQRLRRIGLLAFVVLICTGAAAQAHGGWAVGINIGAPWCYRPYPYYYGYYPPYPVYVAPAPVVVQTVPAAPAPVVQQVPVVQQPAAAPPAQTAQTPPGAPATQPQAVTLQPVQVGAGDERRTEIDQDLNNLASPDERVRLGAAQRLGQLRAQRAAESLTRTLATDRSPAVRDAAARALGMIGAPTTLTALQRAAQGDDDAEVRHSAQTAAEAIRARLPR